VGWISWIQEWVPRRLRGRYFGARNRTLQVTTVLFLLLVGFILDWLDRTVLAFQVVLIGSVALRALSVSFQQRTYTGGAAQEVVRYDWRAQLTLLQKHSAYFWFVAFGAAWGFAANLFGAFYPVFMYEQLGLSVKHVSSMLILTSVGSAVSYPAWGKLADRFGNKPVMLVCLAAWQVQYASWAFLTPSNAWLLYIYWAFAGSVSAGFVLGLFNIQLKLIPREAKTLAISINIAVTSLVTALAPIIGGALLQYLLSTYANPLWVYHRLFLIQPAVALLACGFLLRLPEPDTSPLSTVVGAMRNVRTLGGIFGLTYLTNFVFVKAPKSWSRRSTRSQETSSASAR
jgi:MFS family permease